MPKVKKGEQVPVTAYQLRIARAKVEGARLILQAVEEAWRNAFVVGATDISPNVFTKLVFPAQKVMSVLDIEYKVQAGLITRAAARELIRNM